MRIKHEGKVELVDSEVRLRAPAGEEQGKISSDLLTRLNNFGCREKLGRIFDAQAGFGPWENTQVPDISFARAEKLPSGRPPKGFPPLNLAFEVLRSTRHLPSI